MTATEYFGTRGEIMVEAPFVSRAVRATRGSASLRVTIPQVVASTLGLHPGDDVNWIVEARTGVIRIERLDRGGPEEARPTRRHD
jgi:hypothetical protein